MLKRITQELNNLVKEPIDNIELVSSNNDESNILCFNLYAPENTDYAGGKFKIQFEFLDDYPYIPPRVIFITKVYSFQL